MTFSLLLLNTERPGKNPLPDRLPNTVIDNVILTKMQS